LINVVHTESESYVEVGDFRASVYEGFLREPQKLARTIK
jgi:hypothetical protein